jgi:hypothetical protein
MKMEVITAQFVNFHACPVPLQPTVYPVLREIILMWIHSVRVLTLILKTKLRLALHVLYRV